MVKLNLLDLPNTEESTRTIEPKKPVEEPRHSEIDFSFFQPDDDHSTIQVGVQEPPPPPPPVEEPEDTTVQQNPFAIQDSFQGEYVDDKASDFESTAPRGWIPWALGLMLIIGLAGIGVWWWLNRPSNIKVRPRPTANQPVDPSATNENPIANNIDNNGNNPDPANPANNNANIPSPANNNNPPSPANNNNSNNPPVNYGNNTQRQLARNNGENQYHLGFATQFLDVSAPNTAYSLLVVTPGHVYLSVLGDTRDDIAVFRTKVKENATLAPLHLKTENAEVVLVDGQQKFLSDLSIEIASGNAPSRPASGAALSTSDVRGVYQQLARKHGLALNYFQQGQPTREAGFRTTNFYSKVAGTQTAVLNFLGEMARAHPSLRINKISIYPASGSTLENGRVESRIEVTQFDPS